ncbi:MAG: hypothetical protein KJ956_04995 [Actinobacteria bacterium]|nr:hypothetical protein [Actinomycetota bacterium]
MRVEDRLAGSPERGPGTDLRWLVVLVAAGVFGVALWLLGSGAQTTPDREIPSDLEGMIPLTPPGTVAQDDGGPDAGPAGPLRRVERLNRVQRVAVAPDGSLWAATDGGVIRWNLATGAVAVFDEGQELPTGAVAGIVVGADGTVWAGSPGWIGRWDGAWTRFSAPAGFERPLAVAADGVVWWASSEAGRIGRFDGSEWEVFEGIVPFGSESIVITPDGTAWVATVPAGDIHDGVAVFSGSEWDRFGTGDGLPGSIGGSVAVAGDGTVWVGSMGSASDRQPGGGVAHYDGSMWSVFTVADGLVSNDVAVASGADGVVWAVAPEGLSRFDGSEWATFPDVIGFGFGAVVDGSGVLWAPAADLGGGVKGFDGAVTRRLAVGVAATTDADQAPPGLDVRSDLPDDARLDFPAAVCVGVGEVACYRDGRILDPQDPSGGSGTWAAGQPFHIRQGFGIGGEDLLGDGYDIAVLVTRRAGPVLDDGSFVLGRTYRFHTDFLVGGVGVRCGPADWDRTDPQSCVWFVHDFPDGLPPGRYDIWVEWQAPCAAWLDLGLTDVCYDPDEVAVLFASSVSMPFYGPGYWQDVTPAFDPFVYPEPITRGAEGG